MKQHLLLLSAILICVLFTSNLFSQGVAINTSGNQAHSSAMLDVSSTTGGLLTPRMTQAQRTAITSPATGLLVYQTDGVQGFYYFDGSTWTRIGTGSGSVTSVGLAMPSIFSVTNSPVTSSGTLTANFVNQSANYVFAGPASGGAGTPTFRPLVAADIPALNYDNYNYWVLQGSGANASNVTSGTTINFTGSGATSVSKSGNTITISSTDANTTYSAGTGLNLTGTTFSLQTPVSIANGGTNANTYTQNQFLWYNGTSIVASGYDQNSFATASHTHQTLTRGTGLTGGNYNGSTAQTWAVDFGTGTNQAARGDHTHTGMTTGSGTTNYVTKWTGTSTLGNSQIFDNGTNVGIGTTTPGHKLDISGNVKIGDNIMVEGSNDYKVYRNLASYSVNNNTSPGAFVITTQQPWNSTCMFRIKIEGYFYDATAPFELIAGGYIYNTNTFYNYGYITIGGKQLRVRFARNNSTNTLAIILGDESSTYPYPKLTVTSFMQGYGGINEAYADGWTINQYTSLANFSYIHEVPNVSTLPTGSNNYIQNQTAADQSASFRISGNGLFSNGNVGIGTLSPASKLTIAGTGDIGLLQIANVRISSVLGNDLVLRSLDQLRFTDGNDWNWNTWGGIKFVQGENKMVIGGPNSVYFSSNASPPNISVVFDGVSNVGIGTTAPAYRLDLAQGTFGFGDGNSRTETRNNAGLQGDAGAQSGFFQTEYPVNYPAGATSWWHLLDVRHSNPTNNYAMQFAGSFFDQNLYFRKTNNNASTPWSKVLTVPMGNTNNGNYAWTMSANFSYSPDDLWGHGGTSGGTLSGDENYVSYAMPFSLTIEGTTYNTITISTNGWVAFGSVSGAYYTNYALPTSTFSNPVICAYWDDLVPTGNNIRYGFSGTDPNRTVIIDFEANTYSGSYPVRFQVQIHEGSGLINVKYRDSMNPNANGQSATIGFQLHGGSNAKAYPITYNGKVLDDNRDDGEGWSICPVR